MQINPYLAIRKFTDDLVAKGLTVEQADLAAKALPSQPVWTSTSIDYGFWDANREKLLSLMAIYQKNERVHGCIDIIAKTVCNAGCQLMKSVKGANNKKLARRLVTGKRWRRLRKQWNVPQLARKALDEDEGLEEITEHPMLDALNSDDNDQNFHSTLRLMIVNLCVFGIAFFKKERDSKNGPVTSYLYLPAYNVTPRRGDDGRIDGWFYSSTYGEAIPKAPIDKDDMLVVRFPSLTDPHAGGDSPLQPALRQIDLFGKMLDWQDWTFTNRGRMDGVFIPKTSDGGSLSPEEASRAEKRINDKLRGPGNGRWMVSEQAGQFVPMTWAPTDLATLEVEDKVATAVMFSLNVPEAFGNNDGNRANLEGSLEQFARFCIAPIISLVESALNTELKSEFDEDGLMFVFENVIPEDKSFALEEDKVDLLAWQSARAAGDVSANEYRTAVLGIDEDPDLDKDTESDDNAIGPVTVAQNAFNAEAAQQTALAGTPEANPTPKTAPVAAQPAPLVQKSFNLIALNRMVSRGRIDRATAINIAAHELSMPDEDAKRLVTFSPANKKKKPKLPPVALPNTDDLAAAIKHQIGKQKSVYLSQCDDIAKSLVMELATKGAGDDDDGTGAAVDTLPSKFTAEADWDAADMMAYKPYLQLIAERTANSRVNALIDIGAEEGVFGVVQPNIAKAVDKSTLKFCQSTNDATEKELNDALEQLRQQIIDGSVDGDPPTLLRKRVQSVFENIDDGRAQVIAKTEGSRASHEAQRITAKASGIVKGFKLLASSECCDECADLDGTEVGMDEQFQDDDYDDSILPIHPNCRCTMTEVLDLDAMEDEE